MCSALIADAGESGLVYSYFSVSPSSYTPILAQICSMDWSLQTGQLPRLLPDTGPGRRRKKKGTIFLTFMDLF